MNFFILITTPISFLLALLLLILGVLKNKTVLTNVCIATLIFHVIQFVLYLFSLRINPTIGNVINIISIICLFLTFLFSITNLLSILLVLFTSLVIVLVAFLADPAYAYKTYEGDTYIGVYDKMTGVSKTVVRYYKMYGHLFISGDCVFDEDYGIIFVDYKDIFNYEPYETHYYK